MKQTTLTQLALAAFALMILAGAYVVIYLGQAGIMQVLQALTELP